MHNEAHLAKAKETHISCSDFSSIYTTFFLLDYIWHNRDQAELDSVPARAPPTPQPKFLSSTRSLHRQLPMAVLLLDIEGTVCPITFVKDVLFPYFLQQYSNYLEPLQFPIVKDQNDLAKVLLGFPYEVTQTKLSLTAHIDSLVKNDIKDPTLKAFQGIVWKMGYDKGDLKAPLYPDAIKLLESAEKIYIYSSGSVPAQKLLFSHVDIDGKLVDLTPKLQGYYDITTAGFKQEKDSYIKIAQSIGCQPQDIVFYSDNVQEVSAALAAGMGGYVVVRPGNAPLTTQDRTTFQCIDHF